MIGVTSVQNRRGDLEAHLAGCADIDKVLRQRSRWGGGDPEPVTAKAETLLDAILDFDREWADAWCEIPYTDSAVENGAWTLSHMAIKPCLVAAMRAAKVRLGERGRPEVAP